MHRNFGQKIIPGETPQLGENQSREFILLSFVWKFQRLQLAVTAII